MNKLEVIGDDLVCNILSFEAVCHLLLHAPHVNRQLCRCARNPASWLNIQWRISEQPNVFARRFKARVVSMLLPFQDF